MHSSQNEQDSRNFARFAKVPIFEPADSGEAKEFLIAAIELSEKYKTPVLLRTTTRVSHSRSLVQFGERKVNTKTIGLEKNPARLFRFQCTLAKCEKSRAEANRRSRTWQH
jgi:indolepyruvate ferredoxin oxidoreductase alpha subunit